MSESTAERSTAAVVRGRVMRSSGKFVRPQDFAGPRGAVLREPSRRVEAGDLRHVRKGLYWRGQKTMLGMAPPAPLDLVQELVGVSGVGPAESSAALALGLSTQHPRRETFAVPVRPPTCADARVALKDRTGRKGRRGRSSTRTKSPCSKCSLTGLASSSFLASRPSTDSSAWCRRMRSVQPSSRVPPRTSWLSSRKACEGPLPRIAL